MKIRRIEHVAIAVESIRESIDLLQGTLGLRLDSEEQIGETKIAMLAVGDTHIEILEGHGADSQAAEWVRTKGAGLYHICFEVENIDEALADLRAKGVKLRDESPRIGHGGARVAFVDPSSTGNVLIELSEPPRAA